MDINGSPRGEPSPLAPEIATLGGGCFWCLEAVFADVRGVDKVTPGYAGGTVVNPSYEEVCRGTTGHAEVVQLAFQPDRISFEELLDIFFAIHDPTTRDRQGADVGPQYRSVIFYHTPEQERKARDTIRRLDAMGVWPDPIVTELAPFTVFYPAEPYHHEYYRRNPEQAYCRVVIAPKVATLRTRFASKLKS